MSDPGDGNGSVIDISIRNYRLGTGVGAGAYVVAYALTYVLAVVDGATAKGVDTLWRGVGWLLYGAHNVRLQVDLEVLGDQEIEPVNALTDSSRVAGVTESVPHAVYLLLPVLVLVGSGFVAYKLSGEGELSTRGAAGLGATVLYGYYGLAIIGMFLFTLSFGPNRVGPWLGQGFVLLALYPALFGAIGGIIAHQTG